MRDFNKNNVTSYNGTTNYLSSITFKETNENGQFSSLGTFHQQEIASNMGENKYFQFKSPHAGNILLGSAMLILIIMMLSTVCYCCHRNIKKRRENEYRSRPWLENDPNDEVYSVGHYAGGISLNPQPPPSYDVVLAIQEEMKHHLQHRCSPPPGYMNNGDHFLVSNDNPQLNHLYQRTNENLGAKTIVDHQSCCCSPQSGDNRNSLNVVEEASASSLSLVTSTPLPLLTFQNSQRHFPQKFGNRGCSFCDQYCSTVTMPLNTASGYENYLNTVPCQLGEHEGDQNGNSFPNSLLQHISKVSKEDSDCPTQNNVIAGVETDKNNNSNLMCENNNVLPTSSPFRIGENICESNENESQTTTTTAAAAATRENHQNESIDDLSSINGNGMIRLDMSKIIDKTGLPTYEAALKLDSSGYV